MGRLSAAKKHNRYLLQHEIPALQHSRQLV
jgi:hypothetical protein